MRRQLNWLAFIVLLAMGAQAAAFPEPERFEEGYKWLLRSPLREYLSSAAERYLVLKYGELSFEDFQPRQPLANIIVNDREQDTHPEYTGQEETTIAVFGKNIVVGWNDSNPPPARSFTGYGYSTDGGETFIDGGTIPPPPGGFTIGDPDVAVDRRGHFYFSMLIEDADGVSAIGVAKSTDGGRTFSIPVNASPGTDPANFQDKEFLTVDTSGGPFDGSVYVSWTEFFATGGNRILFSRSTDGGRSFSTPIQISPDGQGVQGSIPRVGPKGEIYVAWEDFDTPAIRISKSTDGGLSFGADGVDNVLVAPLNFVTSRSLECGRRVLKGDLRMHEFPGLAINPRNGDVYVVFTSNPPGPDESDIFFTRSTDGGQTFSEPIRVNDDLTINDQFWPFIAVASDGTIGVAFYDRRNDPKNLDIDVYLAVSTDDGLSFQPNKRITEQTFPTQEFLARFRSCYWGDYLYITADAEYFYIAWGDNRNKGLTWANRARMRVPRAEVATAAVGHHVYAIGGYPLSKPNVIDSNLNEAYNIRTDHWSMRAPAPTARSGATAASDGRYIYVIGGVSTATGEVLSTFERYDPTWDSWTTLDPMPTPRAGLGVAIVDGVLYAIGGRDCVFDGCGTALDIVEAYEIKTGKWTTKAPMPTPRMEIQSTVAVDEKIYVFGGYNAELGGFLRAAEVYDPVADKWEELEKLPTVRVSAAAGVCGKQVLIVGGFWFDGRRRVTANLYDIESNSYKPVVFLNIPRAEFQLAKAGEKLIAVGGTTDRRFVGTKQLFDCAVMGYPRPDSDVFFAKEPVTPSPITEPDIDVKPNMLDFGFVRVGKGKSLELTIKNTGGAKLVIKSVRSDSGAFIVRAPGLPKTLAPADQMKVSIRALPGRVGQFMNKLTIVSNDPDEPKGTVILLATGTRRAVEDKEEFELRELRVAPNPVMSIHTAEFEVEGEGVQSVQLEVFNLAGKRVFDSGEVEGKTFQWHLQNEKGQVVANGVYLYIVTVRGFNDEILRSRVQKLIVLR